MASQQRVSAAFQVGAYLCLLGGMVFVFGFFVPWITYHTEGGYFNSTVSGWQNLVALGSPLGGSVIGTVLGLIMYMLWLCPLLMAANALSVVAQSSLVESARWRRRFRRAFWPITILGTLVLLWMTYGLDPFGLDLQSMWVAAHDPQPTIQPGLYMVYAGTCVIILGGLLMRAWGMGAARTDTGAASQAAA